MWSFILQCSILLSFIIITCSNCPNTITFAHTCTQSHLCACAHAHTHTNTQTHTNTHTCIDQCLHFSKQCPLVLSGSSNIYIYIYIYIYIIYIYNIYIYYIYTYLLYIYTYLLHIIIFICVGMSYTVYNVYLKLYF